MDGASPLNDADGSRETEMQRVFRRIDKRLTTIFTIAMFLFAVFSATIVADTSADAGGHGLIEAQLVDTQSSPSNSDSVDACCSDPEHATHSDTAHCGSLCHFFAEATDVFYPRETSDEMIAALEQSYGLHITPFKRPPKTHL